MLRLDQNPPQIFVPGSLGGQEAFEPEIADVAASGSTWLVLRSKSNRDKRLAFDLMRLGVGFFFPMERRRNPKDRRMGLKALFSGIMFACAMPGKNIRSPHLFQAKVVHEEWKLIRDLTALKQGLDNGTIKTLADLVEGKIYRVTDGAYEGCEGSLVEKDHRGRWGYLMSFLGPIRIDAEALELVA